MNTLLVNPRKRLGLYGLLNLLQDTAWIHATHLGHGYEEMIKDGQAWVLTRQKIKMDSWPQWRETIELVTWVRPVTSMVAIRDFEIYLSVVKVARNKSTTFTQKRGPTNKMVK